MFHKRPNKANHKQIQWKTVGLPGTVSVRLRCLQTSSLHSVELPQALSAQLGCVHVP